MSTPEEVAEKLSKTALYDEYAKALLVVIKERDLARNQAATASANATLAIDNHGKAEDKLRAVKIWVEEGVVFRDYYRDCYEDGYETAQRHIQALLK